MQIRRIKIVLMVVLASAMATTVAAQVIPTTQTQPSATTQPLNPTPAAYGTISLSYVRSWDAAKPISVDTVLSSASRSVQEVKQTTQYVDGLGRPLQTVIKGISPNGFDMVSPEVYDSFGREQFKYLAYVSPSSDGNFKTNPFTEENNFLKSFYNPTNDANGEKFFYSQTVFEPSPLNRPLSAYPAGNSWAGTAKGSSLQYLSNTAADSVVIWNIAYVSGNTPTSAGYYATGTLYKNITVDERGNSVVEYKDLQGKTILKKVQLWSSPASGHSGWLCTYYIYDDLSNLRFVIQPQGTEWLRTHSWTFDATAWKTSVIAKGLCFSYEYDARQRMTIKRVPGAGEVWLVYDARDRLVMTQDSALRQQGKWLYTDYDSLNRPVLKGIWTTSGDISYHQNLASNSVTYPSPSSGYTVLSQTYYDDYNWVSGSGSGLGSTINTTYNSNTAYFYTPDNTTFPYPQPITATSQTVGMVTGTKTNVLGSSTYLYAVTFYDDRMRSIQTQSTNISGGKDTVTMQFGFSGLMLRTLAGHGKAGAGPQSYLVLTKMTYDAAGRVTQVDEKTGSSAQVTLSKSQFDELGQLKQKNLGLTRNSLTDYSYTTNPVDSLKYSYNIRGWLRGIN